MNKISGSKILDVDEVVQIANDLVGNEEPAVCECCGCEVPMRRMKSRKRLNMSILCADCAQKIGPNQYVCADIDGDLVKTQNPSNVGYVRRYHKGSHAIQ